MGGGGGGTPRERVALSCVESREQVNDIVGRIVLSQRDRIVKHSR